MTARASGGDRVDGERSLRNKLRSRGCHGKDGEDAGKRFLETHVADGAVPGCQRAVGHDLNCQEHPIPVCLIWLAVLCLPKVPIKSKGTGPERENVCININASPCRVQVLCLRYSRHDLISAWRFENSFGQRCQRSRNGGERCLTRERLSPKLAFSDPSSGRRRAII